MNSSVEIFCRTLLHFQDGIVTGEILIDPMELFGKICQVIGYTGPVDSIQDCISEEYHLRRKRGQHTKIHLLDGDVKDQRISLPVGVATDLLSDYLCKEEIYSTAFWNSDFKTFLDAVRLRRVALSI